MKKILTLAVLSRIMLLQSMNHSFFSPDFIASEILSQIIYTLVDEENKLPWQTVVTLQRLKRLNKSWKAFMEEEIDNDRFTNYFIETLYKKKLLITHNSKLALAAILGTDNAIGWLAAQPKQEIAKTDRTQPIDGSVYFLYIIELLHNTADMYENFIKRGKKGLNPGEAPYNWDDPNNARRKLAVYKAMKCGIKINKINGLQMTPLMIAAQCNRNDLVPFLVKKENINKKCFYGRTALMHAVLNQSVACTLQLINAGADVNILDNNRHSALHHAIQKNKNNYQMDTYIVQSLLNAGVDTQLKDTLGLTAQNHAQYCQRNDLEKLIIQSVASKKQNILSNCSILALENP